MTFIDFVRVEKEFVTNRFVSHLISNFNQIIQKTSNSNITKFTKKTIYHVRR